MSQLPITTLTAAFLAVLFVILSVRVVLARFATKTSIGTGDSASIGTGQDASASPLLVAARIHANFAEYVPLSLILLGLIELQGGSRIVLLGLAAALIIARLAHPFGLGRTSPNPARAVGFALNQIMLLCAAIYAVMLGLRF
ncbi:MAG: MAPEG family protein [Alphaproteobacteria bacterium]|nr:MAPEG family protein [Alphaproteobacteria bacterium]